MLARVNSGALVGVEALPVQVEVNSGERGEPKTFVVGLKRIHKPRILGPLEQWILHAVYKNDGQSRAR